jgi:hypothetical protein
MPLKSLVCSFFTAISFDQAWSAHIHHSVAEPKQVHLYVGKPGSAHLLARAQRYSDDAMKYNDKVIPFPAPTPKNPPAGRRSGRIVVSIGSRGVTLDISCRATALSPAAVPASRTADGSRNQGRKQ